MCVEHQPVCVVRFVILYVMARDEDEGEHGRVSYRIQAGNSAGRFRLDADTGETQHPGLWARHQDGTGKDRLAPFNETIDRLDHW